MRDFACPFCGSPAAAEFGAGLAQGGPGEIEVFHSAPGCKDFDHLGAEEFVQAVWDAEK